MHETPIYNVTTPSRSSRSRRSLRTGSRCHSRRGKRCDASGERIARDARLLLSRRLSQTLDAAACETLVDANGEAVRNEGREIGYVLNVEAAERSSDDGGGKAED